MLLLGLSVLLSCPWSVRAQIATLTPLQTINIEYGNPPSPYAGTGVIGNGGTNWNVCLDLTGASLVDESNNVTTVACSGQQQGSFGTGNGAVPVLLDYFSFNHSGSPMPFVFTNLPAGYYNLVLYGINSTFATDSTTFNIGSETRTLYNYGTVAATSSFVANNNYVVFNNVVVVDSGSSPNAISGTYVNTPGYFEGAINGAQLQYLGTGQPFANPIVVSPSVAYSGITVTLTETPSGVGPFTYQWKFNGTNLTDGGNISGSQTATLTLSGIAANQTGSYTVAVTNGLGGTVSTPATVTIIPPPSVGQTINFQFGNPLELYTGTGTVGGGGTIWNVCRDLTGVDLVDEFNNLTPAACYGDLSGSTFNGSIDTPNKLLKYFSFNTSGGPSDIVFTNLAPGVYKVALYGINGTWNGGHTDFTIGSEAHSVTNSNFSTFVLNNNYVVFDNVVVSSTGSSPYAIAATYAASPGFGEGDINGAQLQYLGTGEPVANPIVVSPSNVVFEGTTLTLTESPSGLGPFTYQWKFNGADLSDSGNVSGSQTATLTLSGINTNQAGSYTVAITNATGGVLSAPAAVTVLEASSFSFDLGQTINLQYGNPSIAYTGTGVIGNGGTIWNVCSGLNSDYLLDESNNVTPVIVSGEQSGNFSEGTGPSLLKYYSFNTSGGPLPFLFTNLPAGAYKVVFYSVNGAFASDSTTFVIGDQTNTLVNGAGGDFSFIQNNNYVVFNDIMVSNTGSSPNAISGTYEAAPGFGEGAINGAQIQYLGTGPIVAAPIVVSPAASYVGQTVTLTEVPLGPGPITYQWKLNGADLSDAGNISGSQTATLTITGVTANQAGNYTVAVSNSFGGVVSAPALVTLAYPPPAGQTINIEYGSSTATAYSGTGVIGNGGTNWNPAPLLNASTLVDEFNNPTLITCQGTAAATFFNGGVDTPNILLKHFAVNNFGGPRPFTFSNLPQGAYNVAIYGMNGTYDNATVSFVINGQTNTVINGAPGDTTNFVLNANYVVFTNVPVSSAGTITGLYGGAAANGTWNGTEGVISGAQLQYLGSGLPPQAVPMAVRLSGGSIVLTWPLAQILQLQSNTNLANPNGWVNVPNAPVLVNGQNQVALPQSLKEEYFRLKSQ